MTEKKGRVIEEKTIDIVWKWEKKKDRRDTSEHRDTEKKRKEETDRERNLDRRWATVRLIKRQIRDETYV